MVNFKTLSLKDLYLMWVAVLLIVTAVSFFSGEYAELMSLAVAKSGPLPQGMPHDAMMLAFVIISLVVAFVSVVAGFVFVHFATKDKTWAKWLFLIFCVWQLKESTWESYRLSQMYPDFVFGIWNTIGGIISLALVLLLTVKTIQMLNKKPAGA